MKKIAAILLFLPQILKAENTLSDRINSLFEPIVNVMAKVIFWEPFSAGIPYCCDLVSCWSYIFYHSNEFYQH